MEQIVQKKRVAVYCRVSTDSGEPSLGLAAQEAYYSGMIGGNPDWELAGIYADRGITAADRERRTELNRMIADCESGGIDLIVTRSVSRFARSIADCVEAVRTLKAGGVGVIFEKEGISTLTESGDRFLSIFHSLARREAEAVSRGHGYPMSFPRGDGRVHMRG